LSVLLYLTISQHFKSTSLLQPIMSTYFKIQQIPGKGNGLVATHDFIRGMKVIAETPLLSMSNADDQAFTDEKIETLARYQGVSDEDWQIFRDFYTRFAPGVMSDLCGRFLSGSFTSKNMHGSETGMVFLNISRITHSCSPNCVYSFNNDKNEGRLYAIKNIKGGEEITISYGAGMSVPLNQRRAQLQLERGFDCLCELCSKTGDELVDSMRRLKRIDQLVCTTKRSLESGDLENRPLNCLRDIFLRLMYLKEEGIRDGREAQCYRDAHNVVAHHGDAVRAKEFAKLYFQARKDCFGEDSDEFAEAKQLAKAGIQGGKSFNMKWGYKLPLVNIAVSREEVLLWMLDRDDYQNGQPSIEESQ
jgi:hypothetical protein